VKGAKFQDRVGLFVFHHEPDAGLYALYFHQPFQAAYDRISGRGIFTEIIQHSDAMVRAHRHSCTSFATGFSSGLFSQKYFNQPWQIGIAVKVATLMEASIVKYLVVSQMQEMHTLQESD
jgi:hypothetical protein